MDVDIRTVVGLAELAPSVHNTQPWRFRWDGTALTVHEDDSRSLPVMDPSGRERVLSCGAAVLNARLGFAELGWTTRTTLLPGPDVLARIEVTGAAAPSAEDHELAQAIPHRTTDRDPYDARPLPAELQRALHAAAEAEGAFCRQVSTVDDRVELAVLLAHADASQLRDPAYLAELAAWRRDDTAPDGVPDRALPRVPTNARGSELPLRDFDAAAGTPAAERRDAPPPAEHPHVLVLGTSGDEPLDWLRAGQAAGRLLLRAAVDGVAAQPLTSVLEVPVLRQRLRSELQLLGHPQMVVRLGYGSAGPTTHRRPVDDVLEIVG